MIGELFMDTPECIRFERITEETIYNYEFLIMN